MTVIADFRCWLIYQAKKKIKHAHLLAVAPVWIRVSWLTRTQVSAFWINQAELSSFNQTGCWGFHQTLIQTFCVNPQKDSFLNSKSESSGWAIQRHTQPPLEKYKCTRFSFWNTSQQENIQMNSIRLDNNKIIGK